MIRVAAVHGTDSGYYRHRRRADPAAGWPQEACGDCRAAHAAAEAKRTSGGERRRRRREEVRRARAEARQVLLVCPDCGGSKTPRAARCRPCAVRLRSTIEHGTDSGYYRHVRIPEPDNDWPRTACADCLAAHAAARRNLTGGQPFVPRTQRYCPGCDKPISDRAKYCRSCAQVATDDKPPPRWMRVGMIWKVRAS